MAHNGVKLCLHFGGLLGIASFANHTDDRPLGFAIAAHGGYDFPVGEGHANLGVGLRVLYASMGASELGRAQVFSPLLMVHYAYR